jgi:uncharacterized protein YpmB
MRCKNILATMAVIFFGTIFLSIITSLVLEANFYQRVQEKIKEQEAIKKSRYITTLDGIEYYDGPMGVYYVDTREKNSSVEYYQ